MNEYEAVITLRNSLYWLDKTNISNDELDKTREAIETLWQSAKAWDKALNPERKALLVITRPDNCCECPFMAGGPEAHFCQMGDDGNCNCLVSGGQRPHWCPLVELPDKKDPYANFNGTIDVDTYPYAEAIGWNACLDALEGKT